MEVVKTIFELRKLLSKERVKGNRIGLVPTMGALHHGHISLLKASKKKCKINVVSIFVNPTQFNNKEDLDKYPKTLQEDIRLLEDEGCDFLFLPSVEDIYPFQHDIKLYFGEIENNLEGRFRPGHFSGVGLVVSKLFNLCQPDEAFFGQKDLQQFFIIKKLIDQLSFPIELNIVETARENNGLAMSSRNLRLTQNEKLEAALLYKTLKSSREHLLAGESIGTVVNTAKELFERNDRFTLEYFEVIETDNFKSVEKITDPKKTAICIAAVIGNVRLIDNLLLNY